MRPRRSDSTPGTSTKQPTTSSSSFTEDAPNIKAEIADQELNRTPEENKNPHKLVTKVVLHAEKSCSFTPPPALSPAYSIQEHEKMEEEIDLKMEVDSDHEEEEEEKTPKKQDMEEKKEEKTPASRQKMKYKKRVEKEKDAVPFTDPNAPRKNRSAYVHFIIHRRASYSKAVMSQRDINIALAADWQKLTPEERVPFQKKADEEKEKFLELYEEYKKTESHKEFQKARSKFLSSQNSSSNSKQRKRKHGDSDDDEEIVQMPFPKTNVFCPLLQTTSDTSSSLQYAGPIFTPEFMAYNKTRDSYRRQLIVERANVEHELEALHQHDMDVRIQKQEDRIRSVDEKIDETMEKMRSFFGGMPASKDHLSSIDAITEWLQSVTRMGPGNHTKKAVKELINKNAKAIIAIRK